MKSDIFQTFRRKIIIYALTSLGITAVIEILLLFNLRVLFEFLINSGYQSFIIGKSGINAKWHVIFLALIGIFVFIICFLILLNPLINYIKKISNSIRKISEGDLNEIVEVKGNDEFAVIAENLNKMTEEIKILMERERASERSKNDLITSVAHDLRTPLTSIIGYLELLKNNKNLEKEQQQKYIEVAYGKSKRLQKLIEELFGFTKLNHGEIKLQIGKLDIIKLVEQMLDEFYPSFQEYNLEYEYQYSESSIIMEADGNLLARLFENLINNAIKYGADGKLIRIEVKYEGESARIRVINYGKVIPSEEINNIFEKFYRVEQSRSQNTGGTGLGLAIAKSVAEIHGGDIRAESSLKGTIFEVRLPVSMEGNHKKFSM